MNEEIFNKLQQKLYDFSGIKIAETQKKSLSLYVEELAHSAGVSPKEYCDSISPQHDDFPLLINHITVNETYFFREERQFDVLKKHIFPKFQGKRMNIWSGACSSGEEAISLLTLALSYNIDVHVFATDIDDNALEKFKNGIYTQYSFRSDGKKYHELLSPYYKKEGDRYVFDKILLEKIHVCKYNLKNDGALPFSEKMDLVFLRNVFIYFEKDTRIKISKNICSSLTDQGCLFFSMNEIGCLDDTVIPSSMYKTNLDSVYYFVKGKNPDAEKRDLKVKTAIKSTLEKRITQIKEKRSELISPIKEIRNDIRKPEIKKQSVFNKVSAEIDKKDFESARKMVEEDDNTENRAFYYFLHGYIEYHADNKEKAERFLSTAEILQSDFWPVSFYHGMVLRDIGKKDKSNVCLKKCMELLNSSKTDLRYDFTLDNFSPRYIYSLCETMMKE